MSIIPTQNTPTALVWFDGNRFLKDSSDIVLDFPFKDCVLNGGQSTEEGEEIYFKRNNDQSDSQLYTKLTRKKTRNLF